jgi:glycosyltransferase involved in cell wall biosynthesis
MNLRVLHIHSGYGHSGGGGGIALQRLHRRLLQIGVDSKILSLDPESGAPDVSPLPVLDTLSLERRLHAVTGRLGLNDVHRLGAFQLDRHTLFQNADLVHFHCMHSGTFSYLALPRIARLKPTVFTLHDMWALTGHCAYSYECDRWKSGCGDCPHPAENPAIRRDATHLEWRLKRRAFLKSGTHLISKCGWTTRMARVSSLRHLPLTQIPYGVDTDVFRPLDVAESRELLGLPQDAHVLLHSAQDLLDLRKGTDLLVKALEGLPADLARRTILLTMGRGGAEVARATGLSSRDFGYVADDHFRSIAYSAADLFLFPTRADVFGLVSAESQACGTPVVSFRVGGVPDHVRPGRTGFLAEPGDVGGFRDGVTLLLENEAARRHMSEQCRAAAVAEYDLGIEVARHAVLYEAILNANGRPCDGYRDSLVPPLPEGNAAPAVSRRRRVSVARLANAG